MSKKNLSALELHYIVKELEILKNSRVYKIYQPDKDSLFIQFHVTSIGKKILTINLPTFIYFTDEKKTSENPLSFCMLLRKYLNNTRLREIKQIGFERILEFLFETKSGKFHLIIELFSKGNIILCDDKYKIIKSLEDQYWKDRTIKRNETYKFPKPIINIFTLTEKQLKEIIKNSKRDSIVKTLAIELSLGGLFAEETCLLSNIAKQKKKVNDEEINNIFKNIKKLTDKKPNPQLIFKENQLIDAVPFELELYKEYDNQPQKTFNESIDIIKKLIIKDKEEKESKQIMKIKNIIKKQKETIKELALKIKENQRKGNLIYENYQLINSILKELKEIRKKTSWKEIKEKLKGHKLIKDINEKESKIIINIK